MKTASKQLISCVTMYVGALFTLLPLVAGLETNYLLALDQASETLNANVTHKRSSTSSITIAWATSPADLLSISEYHIYYHKEDGNAISRTFSIPSNATEYEIEHLVRSSKFVICLVATHMDASGSKRYEKACVEHSTLPLIRNDSLLALFITFLYIIGTFIAAYIVWRKRKSDYEDEKNQAELERKSEGSMGSKADANQSNYLLPPKDKKQRLSIEDPNIPYITPPVSEVIEDEDQSEATIDYRENYRETTLVRT